jgi:hypothetical protein
MTPMPHLLLALALFAIPIQTGHAAFTGTWTAELAGRPFIRLELSSTNGTLTGSLGTGNIHWNDAGVVDEATPLPAKPSPLVEITQRGPVITIARIEGQDREQFEFQVLADGTGQLAMVLTEEMLQELKDEGIPVPKPITLTKAR